MDIHHLKWWQDKVHLTVQTSFLYRKFRCKFLDFPIFWCSQLGSSIVTLQNIPFGGHKVGSSQFVAKISLGWIKLRLVGSSLKTETFFEGGKPPPETADVVTWFNPLRSWRCVRSQGEGGAPMFTRSQTWHDQKHVAFVRSDGCLYNHPYFERKLGEVFKSLWGMRTFFCLSPCWISHPRNLRCWSASTKFIKLFKSKWRLNQFAFKLWSIDIFQRISTSFCLLDGRISQSLTCIGANTNKPTISFLWDLTCIRESLLKSYRILTKSYVAQVSNVESPCAPFSRRSMAQWPLIRSHGSVQTARRDWRWRGGCWARAVVR